MGFDSQAWGVVERGGVAMSTAANFTAGAASACNALPAAWGDGDYWVSVTPVSYATYVVFTDQVSLTASVPAASAAGAQAVGLGEYCPAGSATHLKVPTGCIYFARIAPGGTTDVVVSLRSGPGESS